LKRTILTILAVLGALAVVFIFAQGTDRTTVEPADGTPETVDAAPDERPGGDVADEPDDEAPQRRMTEPGPAADESTPTDEPTEIDELGKLKIVEAATRQPEPTIGDTARDPAENPWAMKVVFTPWGAAVKSIHLSRYSHDALEHDPYRIQSKLEMPTPTGRAVRYPLAASTITVNGQTLTLANMRWQYEQAESTETTKVFSIIVAEAETDTPVLRLRRVYELEPGYTTEDGHFVEGRYDLKLHQTIENLTTADVELRFSQLGQADMPYAKSYLGDRRSFVLGYFQPTYDATRTVVFIDGTQFSRSDVAGGAEYNQLWPNERSDEKQLELVYAAMTNRYFATAVHGLTRPDIAPNGAEFTRATPLDRTFPLVNRALLGKGQTGFVLTSYTTETINLAGGKTADLSIAFFAGPKAPDVIEDDPIYSALGLDELIIYNLGGCCAVLTFSWLADFLIWFLKLIHTFTFDWGVAIVILVLVVRGILHPITKRSQVNMMKFGKQMQKLQPELERLKKKHKDDQSKLNQEMMKLYREKGVNPAAMGLGCLPMFLQMPIWIALYAMLFFAIELRHQPAFYDVFHRASEALGFNWRFLTDLSAPDNFIQFPEFSVLGFFTLSSFNILPVLMAVVFYIQQKFTTQPTANMSEQAQQQQKIMKFMMLLFPIFLYKAPSGLTLYILASTAAGIIDSYFVRKHLKEQEEAGTLFDKKPPKPGGFMDRMQKAAEAKRKQMEQQQKRMQGNQPRRKKRR